MLTVTLFALFALAAASAVAVMAGSWRQHGAAVLAARGALRECPETLEVRYAVREIKVLRGPAKLLVLPVRQAAYRAPQAGLRAAA